MIHEIYAKFLSFIDKINSYDFLTSFFAIVFPLGISIIIANYRKGDFLVLFRDRSGAVRRYSIPHARKKSSKNALFSVLRIFAEKKSPSCGTVFARQTTEIVLDRTLMGV